MLAYSGSSAPGAMETAPSATGSEMRQAIFLPSRMPWRILANLVPWT